jgi:hypothetical protein
MVHDKWSLQRDLNPRPLWHESLPLPLDHRVSSLDLKIQWNALSISQGAIQIISATLGGGKVSPNITLAWGGGGVDKNVTSQFLLIISLVKVYKRLLFCHTGGGGAGG